MDAVKFINEKVRMCNSNLVEGICTGCCLQEFDGCDFDELVEHDKVEEAVKLVAKWSKENPRPTRQSVFIHQYPQVPIYNGVIGIKPCQLVAGYSSYHCLGDSSQCVQCRKEYWLQEVE